MDLTERIFGTVDFLHLHQRLDVIEKELSLTVVSEPKLNHLHKSGHACLHHTTCLQTDIIIVGQLGKTIGSNNSYIVTGSPAKTFQ